VEVKIFLTRIASWFWINENLDLKMFSNWFHCQLAVTFINILRTHFSYKCHFSSYVLALSKKFVQKIRAFNVGEIDGWTEAIIFVIFFIHTLENRSLLFASQYSFTSLIKLHNMLLELCRVPNLQMKGQR